MLGPNPKILAYLYALEECAKANKASEEARKAANDAQEKLHDAKVTLAQEYGYSAGQPPMNITVDEERVIRLSSRERGRCDRSGREHPPEIVANVEKLK